MQILTQIIAVFVLLTANCCPQVKAAILSPITITSSRSQYALDLNDGKSVSVEVPFPLLPFQCTDGDRAYATYVHEHFQCINVISVSRRDGKLVIIDSIPLEQEAVRGYPHESPEPKIEGMHLLSDGRTMLLVLNYATRLVLSHTPSYPINLRTYRDGERISNSPPVAISDLCDVDDFLTTRLVKQKDIVVLPVIESREVLRLICFNSLGQVQASLEIRLHQAPTIEGGQREIAESAFRVTDSSIEIRGGSELVRFECDTLMIGKSD